MTLTRRHLREGELDHERLWLGVGFLSVLLVWSLALVGPLPPLLCPVKAATGWPCPGCGGTRAVIALLTGSIADAFVLNPLVASAGVSGAAWGVVALGVVTTSSRRWRLMWSGRDVTLTRWCAALAVSGCWIYLVVAGR